MRIFLIILISVSLTNPQNELTVNIKDYGLKVSITAKSADVVSDRLD